MNVLVIGNGGREHAVIQALAKSPKVDKIYAMKGNAGIAELAELVNVDYCDVKAVGDWVDQKGDIDFTVVTPDDPLALGLVDELERRGHRAFGPNKNAAVIEASKAFSKELMKKYHIPTAKYQTFSDYESAAAYVQTCEIPVVLKADGLALGKGVLICKTREEAVEGIKEMMLDKKFGAAGNKVVVEEFLEGPEVSCLAFTDGKTIKPMITSCDHKRAKDNDEGLNTGGMGTFSPAPFFGEESAKEVMETIIRLNREKKITVVLITHHMDEAARAQRVVVMHGGKIAADGTPKEVFTRVELLHSLGLAAPETVELCYELNKLGFRLPLDRLEEKECAQALYDAVKA